MHRYTDGLTSEYLQIYHTLENMGYCCSYFNTFRGKNIPSKKKNLKSKLCPNHIN